MTSPFDTSAVLAARARGMEEAPIMRMSRLAREERAKGRDIISFTLGEPDFDTPKVIRQTACAALEEGYTHYPPMPGFPEVRAAIAEKLRRENGLDVGPEGIVVSAGAKQALANTLFALVEPGDEVILIAPYWAAYLPIIELAGGVPIFVPTSAGDGFLPPAEQIAEAISERSKLLLINSPCNPSGAVFPPALLEEIAELARAHPRLMVLSDEIYEYILFDDARHVSIGALPGMAERTITVNGFSKGFAMTGWRLGYSASMPAMARAIAKMQGSFTAGVNAFSQRAILTALSEAARPAVEGMCQRYANRRALMLKLLKDIPGVRLTPPAGTFYMLPDFSELLAGASGNLPQDDVALAEWLLMEHGVATVPGSAFGAPRTLRLSFATSEQQIMAGCQRLREGLAALRDG